MNYKVRRYFIKAFSCLLFLALVAGCNDSASVKKGDSLLGDSFSIKRDPDKILRVVKDTQSRKLSILVLPPYDEIANAGISPDVQKHLESAFAKDTNIVLIHFSYKQFMNVAYQNIYDKKYCQPIVDKVRPDVIIMTKLELVLRQGKMSEDLWNIKFRIYNVASGKQYDSIVETDGITFNEIPDYLSSLEEVFRNEIEENQKL